MLTYHATSDISTDITLHTRLPILQTQCIHSRIHPKKTSKQGIVMHFDQLLPYCVVGRYHDRPGTILPLTANQTLFQYKPIAIFTCIFKLFCPLRTHCSSLHLPQLAQHIISNLSLNVNHLRGDFYLLIASMLHSTASGHQIRAVAKGVSNNIAFARHVDNFKVELATKVQRSNLAP